MPIAACAHAAAAARALGSVHVAGVCATAGVLGSTLLYMGASGEAWHVGAPVLTGLTAAAYIMGARLTPTALSVVFPPTVFAGVAMTVLCLGYGGPDAVRVYLDGAGTNMIATALGLGCRTSPFRNPLPWAPPLFCCPCVGWMLLATVSGFGP